MFFTLKTAFSPSTCYRLELCKNGNKYDVNIVHGSKIIGGKTGFSRYDDAEYLYNLLFSVYGMRDDRETDTTEVYDYIASQYY